jgi:hypothetical protein
MLTGSLGNLYPKVYGGGSYLSVGKESVGVSARCLGMYRLIHYITACDTITT